LNRARQNHINPTKFGLPNDANELHSPHIEKNKCFQDFMKKLVETDDNEICVLKKWLKGADKKGKI